MIDGGKPDGPTPHEPLRTTRNTDAMVGSAEASAQNTPLDTILKEARSIASSPKDIGDRYERLCKGALSELRQPDGTKRFDNVWLWDEWPERNGPDRGIDLVAEWSSAEGGGLAAVQCKCHGEGSSLTTRELDSFLTESSKRMYRNRVLMHTKTSLPLSCRNRLRDQEKPCAVWNIEEQRSWHLNWWAIAENNDVVPRRRATTSGHAVGNAAQGASLKRLTGLRPTGKGILIALVALGALLFLAGSEIGWLLILGGLIVLGLRKTPHKRSSTSGRPRPAPSRRPSTQRPRSRRQPNHRRDWDDEPRRRSTARGRRRRSSWETEDADYI